MTATRRKRRRQIATPGGSGGPTPRPFRTRTAAGPSSSSSTRWTGTGSRRPCGRVRGDREEPGQRRVRRSRPRASPRPAPPRRRPRLHAGARPITARERRSATRARRRYPLDGFAHYVGTTTTAGCAATRPTRSSRSRPSAADRRASAPARRGRRISGSSRSRHPTVRCSARCSAARRRRTAIDSPALAEVLASADVPNIYLKVAGLHYSPRAAGTIRGRMRSRCSPALAEAFGPGGSAGAPTSPRRRDTPRSVSRSRLCGPLSVPDAADLRLVLGGTLLRLLATGHASG